ncbi:MAG: hypothetical protein NVS9B10_28300 [Nevskia sp.]
MLTGCGGGNTPLDSAPLPAPAPAPAPAPIPTASLAIARDGAGRVTSTPAGIDCGTQCSSRFPAGSAIDLVAVPDSGQEFTGWTGACTGLTPCRVTLDGDRAVGAAFRALPVITPPPPVPLRYCDAYRGPALAGLKSYEGITHQHSSYSDGDPLSTPDDYYRVAAEHGYDFEAGSEHSDSLDAGVYPTLHASCDPTSGSFDPTAVEYCFLNPTGDKLQKWNATLTQAKARTSPTFLSIRGFEWTSDVFGHINVYFSKNFTNAKDDGGYALTMQTFWDWFTRDPNQTGDAGSPTAPVPFGGGSDGLAHFNHPHDKCQLNRLNLPTTDGVCDWNDYALIPAAEPRMFGIEAYNDSNRDDRYQPYLTRALDKGWHLSFVGSEDDHFAKYAVENHPKTVTLAKSLAEDDFKEAWLSRRSYALSSGVHLRASLLADGSHPMGSRLACDAGARVPMTVAMTQKDGTPFAGEYQLYTNGGQMLARAKGTQARFELPVEAGGEHWYFVRVHGADGKSVAYLAPVWIKAR